MTKPLQIKQLGTHIYATLQGFADQRYTGLLQFQITMNQGGVSRAEMITKNAFGYKEKTDPKEDTQASGYPVPSMNLLATMSQKE